MIVRQMEKIALLRTHEGVLAELARAHAPALARLLRYLGIPTSDVEDALQDVFLIAHRRLSETPLLAERPEGWLRGVALNVARNRRRSGRRSPLAYVEEVPETSDGQTPEMQLEATRQRERLLRLLSELPEDHRAALVLFEIDGRPMKEVASLLGCALPTAYKYVTQAQARLKAGFAHDEAAQ